MSLSNSRVKAAMGADPGGPRTWQPARFAVLYFALAGVPLVGLLLVLELGPRLTGL